ncbi:MAG: hypothetical protein PWP65_1543 [Clostridia bacterium]|nr:hypothetical protein [Clostridia bacterium]
MSALGEVVASSTREFTAEARELYGSPAFGSFVRVTAGEQVIYGVVYNIVTEGVDAGRRPVAFGTPWPQVAQEHPQLTKLLRTYFSCLTLGFRQGERIYTYLPPFPPYIHSFIEECRREEIKELTARPHYLAHILKSGLVVADQLAAAAIRQACAVQPDAGEYIRRAGRELRRLLTGDLERLKAILRQLE